VRMITVLRAQRKCNQAHDKQGDKWLALFLPIRQFAESASTLKMAAMVL
jgi:hypothetical protein